MQQKTIAEQLTAARKARGMTQEQLSEALNMSRQAISHWETGRSLPDAEMLKKLSVLLSCNLISFEPAEPTKPAEAAEPVAAKPAAESVEQPAASPSAAPVSDPLWKQPVLYLSIAILLLAVTVMLVVLGGRGEPAQPASQLVSGTIAPAVTHAPAAQADVRIIPNQNPITPSIDPVLGPTPWWIYHLTFQETAGVDFTIEKMTLTQQYHDGTTNVVEYGADSVVAFLGSNVLRSGQNLQMHSAEPLLDYAALTTRIDGTDAKGNVLAFECVIYTEMPEPTATPAIAPDAKACLSVSPLTNPVTPVIDPQLGPNPMWVFTFDIFESAGVPLTLEKLTQTLHYTGSDEVETFDGATIANIFGTNQLPGHSALPWTGVHNVSDLTAVTVQVEAIDANGNRLTAEATVTMSTEMPEPTATPVVDPDAKACLNVTPAENPVLPITDPQMGPNPLWLYTFNIHESAGVPLMLEKITHTLHYAVGDETETFDSAAIQNMFGTNWLPGHSALPWTGGHPVYDLNSVTVQVEATDANGNALTAEATITLLKEAAE